MITKPIRRKVTGGHRAVGSLNLYSVTLSCGHSGIAQGTGGKMPKTSRCEKCEWEKNQ